MRWWVMFLMYTTWVRRRRRRREKKTWLETVNVTRIQKRTKEITRVYCTIRIIFFIIYWLFLLFCFLLSFFLFCFFLLQVSFILSLLYCMGGREPVGDCLCKRTGWVYVSMWYYFFLPSPPPTCNPFIPAKPRLWPHMFVTEACTHRSLFSFCPDVFFFPFFSVKLKHVILLLKLLSFLCLQWVVENPQIK